MRKILFISHNASRSGAPMVLLYFMKWIKEHKPDTILDILFVHAGALVNEFSALCDNTFHITYKNGTPKTLSEILKTNVKTIFGIKEEDTNALLFKTIASNNYDLIYSNTVVCVPFGDDIKNLNSKIKHLVHVHELQTIIKTLVPNFNTYLPKIDGFIAVSPQVKQNLIGNWNLEPNLIAVVYEFGVVQSKINDIKTKPIHFVVGSSGYSYWRKGNDVFLQVARYVTKHYPELNIQFKWVGNEYLDKPQIDADIEKLGLSERVQFVGEVEHPIEAYNEFDVFLLLSREDPFPLVSIEVAQLKKPIICFENASGTAEIIDRGGGYVVPYLDVEAVSEKIVYYYHNREKITSDGAIAYNMFKDFTPDIICPQLFEVISRTLSKK